MLRPILAHEGRLLRTSPSTWLALGLLAASVLFGTFNGSRWAAFQRETLAAARAYDAEVYGDLARRAAAADDAWPDPTSAAAIGTFYGRYATLPPAPLAPLAVGQSDVMPYNLYVSSKSLASTYTKTAEELDNPQALVTGRFDAAFALVVVLPLVLLVLLFDVVSGERERGTLALTLAQPVHPRTWVWARAGLRWALVVAVAAVSLMAGLVVFGGGSGAAGAAAGIAVALAAIALYAAVWTAAAVWVAGRGWTSATNALALAAVWVAAVVVVPGLIGVVSGALRPVPPRAALVEAQREAQTHWGDRGADLLLAHYEANPGTRPASFDPASPDFATGYTAVQGALQDTLGPVLAQYDRAFAAQEGLARGLSVLTPAALLQDALATVAGTDPARHAAYLRQVEAFHAAHRDFFVPRAYAARPLIPSDYDRMPRFAFAEASPGTMLGRTAWPLGALLVLTVVLGALASVSTRRLAVR